MKLNRMKTVDSFMEPENHETQDFPLQYRLDKPGEFETECISWHWHREFELDLVSSGEIMCVAGERQFVVSEGEGIFLGSGAFHQLSEARTGTVLPNILFAPEFLAEENSRIFKNYIAPFLDQGIICQKLSPGTPWQREILQCLCEIFGF